VRAWPQLTACVLSLALAGLNAPASAAGIAPAAKHVLWDVPADGAVPWRGIPGTAGGAVGGAGAILYPGGAGLVGFFAAILTHGAIASSAQSAERKRVQDEADKVLLPYENLLRDLTLPKLWQAAQAHLASRAATPAVTLAPGAAASAAAPTVTAEPATTGQARPMFALSQDSRTMVLDLDVVLGGAAAPTTTVIRVIAAPLADSSEAVAHWTRNDGQALKGNATAMLAHALDLAQRHLAVAPNDDVPMRSHRYIAAGETRIERGQLLSSACGRIVIRTLRGGVMSAIAAPAPGTTAEPPAPTPDCPEQERF
jgi:hypothetical protein